MYLHHSFSLSISSSSILKARLISMRIDGDLNIFLSLLDELSQRGFITAKQQQDTGIGEEVSWHAVLAVKGVGDGD